MGYFPLSEGLLLGRRQPQEARVERESPKLESFGVHLLAKKEEKEILNYCKTIIYSVSSKGSGSYAQIRAYYKLCQIAGAVSMVYIQISDSPGTSKWILSKHRPSDLKIS